MARTIKRILISTMPRSGTVFISDFIAELFSFKKVHPVFKEVDWPKPPKWDPYELDESYRSIKDGEVLCAHYQVNEKVRKLIAQNDVLTIYLYRDPRDVAVSAALYIKYALVHHPFHTFFAKMTDAEAILFMLSGGVINLDNKNSLENYVTYTGMKYFCNTAIDWINEKNVAIIRFEDLTVNPVATLESAFNSVNVAVDRFLIQYVSGKKPFDRFTGGRENGVEEKTSHFRKGIVGDYLNYFSDLHTAVCKLQIGEELIALNYESTLSW